MSQPMRYKNISNSCYIHALVQALRHCPQFMRNNKDTKNIALKILLTAKNIHVVYNTIYSRFSTYGFVYGNMCDSEELMFTILSVDDNAKEMSKINGDGYDGDYGLTVFKTYKGVCELCKTQRTYTTSDFVSSVCLTPVVSRKSLSNLICEGMITRGCPICYDKYEESNIDKTIARPKIDYKLEKLNFKTMCIRFNPTECEYTDGPLFPNMKLMLCGHELDIKAIICFKDMHYMAIVNHDNKWFVCNDNEVFEISINFIENYIMTFRLIFVE